MTPRALLAAATRLVEQPRPETAGLWGRAAAMLTRHALEGALDAALAERAPGAQHAPFAVRLLVLRRVHPDAELAERVAYAWNALSRATHQQGYELAPPAASLRAWMAVVTELVG